MSILSILLILACAIRCDLMQLYSLLYRTDDMNVKQKADVGLTKETRFTRYAIAFDGSYLTAQPSGSR